MLNVCIQNLGMYNEGILLWKWLSLPATEEEIDKALTEIRICHEDVNGNYVEFHDEWGNPYEELHIPDWECDLGLEYNEWANIWELNEIAEKVEDLQEYQQHWLKAYMEFTSCDFEEALANYEDNSNWWEGMSKSDVAREMADDNMACIIPSKTGYGCNDATKRALEWMQQYFDYDAYERDLDLDETEDGVIEIYR